MERRGIKLEGHWQVYVMYVWSSGREGKERTEEEWGRDGVVVIDVTANRCRLGTADMDSLRVTSGEEVLHVLLVRP
jgi:hypothetical protein